MAKPDAQMTRGTRPFPEDAPDRDTLFDRYYPLVRSIARKYAAKLPASVEFDDLMATGAIGLITAIERYQPNLEQTFAKYARMRIQGEILDDLRADDTVPRTVREDLNKINKARHTLRAETDRDPSDEEVAARAELTLKRCRDVRVSLERGVKVSLDSLGDDTGRSAHEVLEDRAAVNACLALELREFEGEIRESIAKLKPRLREVIYLYYIQDLNMREIGQIIGVSEARICQNHADALETLQRRLKALTPPTP